MSTTLVTQRNTWTMDAAHSAAGFKVKHMMISSVKGSFTGIRGSLELDEEDVTRSRIEATIEADSVSTNEPQRDAHLRSADFFDVEKFPTLSFRSTRIERAGEGRLAVTGEVTIHGVTRSVVFEAEGPSSAVKDPYGKTRLGIEATTKINRKDFGLTWNASLETGGILVGDEVTINLEVEFVKA